MISVTLPEKTIVHTEIVIQFEKSINKRIYEQPPLHICGGEEQKVTRIAIAFDKEDETKTRLICIDLIKFPNNVANYNRNCY